MTKDIDVDLTEEKLFYLGWSLIYKHVCAPKSWGANKVSDEATKADPPGTSANKWVCSDVSEDYPINPIQCNDDCNRVHWLLNC